MRAWSGINVSGWFRVLWRNRFAVSPSRIPMALILTGLSGLHTSLGVLQSLLYGRRIRQTRLVDDPIFVLGHWRSGTTLLHELLVRDPQHTFPDTYACFAPNDFLLTERFLKPLVTQLLPGRRPMDDMAVAWDRPQEDEWALCNLGLPSPYLTIMFSNRAPQDSAYLDLRGVSPAARRFWQQRLLWFLKCLTLRQPGRIVLKTPLHTFRVPVLLEQFPRARFVHIARDPFAIFPSMLHTWERMYRYHGLQVPRLQGLESYVLKTFSHMYRVFEEDVLQIPADRFCEVRYEDLTREPMAEMQRIYDRLQLVASEAARAGWRDYAEQAAGYRPNRYQVTPEQRQKIVAHWSGYLEKYGYAP